MIAPETVPPNLDPIEQIQGRWTLQILLCLCSGAHRFSDLRAAIPQVSANILASRVRELESAGLIERRYLPPPAARHVYVLANEASALTPALEALWSWRAAKHQRSNPDHTPPNKEKR
jgi:DNA-binding HxlR family transcriptional regulator